MGFVDALKLPSQLLRTRVYSLQHIGLLTFKLLIALQIAFTKINRELQVTTMNASIRLNGSAPDPKNAFKSWHVTRAKAGHCAVATNNRPHYER